MNTFSANLGLPILSSDTKGGLYEFNRAMLNITMNAFCVTQARDRTSPLPNPVEGDIWFVLANGQGAWEGQSNKLAYYYNGWTFITPRIGFQVYDIKTNVRWVLNDNGWYGDEVGIVDMIGSSLSAIQTKINEILPHCREHGLIVEPN